MTGTAVPASNPTDKIAATNVFLIKFRLPYMAGHERRRRNSLPRLVAQ